MKVGDTVTVKEATEAYYSQYAGNPKMVIHPGQIGVIAAVNVPSVWRENVSFCCVDFNVNGMHWRIGTSKHNLSKVNPPRKGTKQ